jgi:aspartyl-tRNA(Asn)/glutamyl-tRNA(Gln) amidotransferase subunit B
MIAEARDALPELPAARRERYGTELGLGENDARQLAFDAELGAYFEAVLDAGRGGEGGEGGEEALAPRTVANWVTGELVARLREVGEGEPADSRVTPEALAALLAMVDAKRITRGVAREVLTRLIAEGGDPAALVEHEDLAAPGGDGELEAIVERAIAENPDAAGKVRAGNPKAIGAIVGAVMRETKGRADGEEVSRLIGERLGAERDA